MPTPQTPQTPQPGQLRHGEDHDEDDKPFDHEAALRRDKKAAIYSVKAHVKDEPKFMVMIHETEDENAVNPVPIINGDYSIHLRRGRWLILPQAAVTALTDAVGQKYNDKTKQWVSFQSYPFQATPYDGKLPLHTEVDSSGNKVKQAA